MGLQGMIDHLLERPTSRPPQPERRAARGRRPPPARLARSRRRSGRERRTGSAEARRGTIPVIGVTGTGRRGQVVAHRRAAAALPRGPGEAVRRALRRPEPQAGRRRAPRRPHPHELDRPRARLHAQLRDARGANELGDSMARALDVCRAAGFDWIFVETLGHRAGRHGHRRRRRRLDLRDDARVRRPEPAREDRHARLRRPRRGQQVRPARRPRTRSATCGSRCAATARSRLGARRGPPVFGTIASRFCDPGVDRLFDRLVRIVDEKTGTPRSPAERAAGAAARATATS